MCSHEEGPIGDGVRVIVTDPAPPWTTEDSRKLSSYFYHGPAITLYSGIVITLQSLRQHLAYSMILEGAPWGGRNDWVIDQTVYALKKSCSGDGDTPPAVVVIYPELLPLPFPDEKLQAIKTFSRREPVSVGPVACRGYFKHSNPVRGESNFDHSSLMIIWFQQEFHSPIPENVVEQIKRIDWDKEAENGLV